jgi:hypothetical protein
VATDAAVTSVAWDALRSELSLFAVLPIAARQNTTVLIPSGVGLRLPLAGLPLGDAGLRISSRVVSLVPSSPVLRFPPVGRFIESSLRFSRFNTSVNTSEPVPLPVAPGDAVALHLTFSANMAIAAGDSITLALSGFSGNFSGVSLLGGNWTVEGGDNSLVFTSGLDVAAGGAVTLVIPQSANLTLPPRGLTANTTDLTIAFNGSSGPVQPAPLSASESVGLLTRRPRARFSKTVAGEVSALHLTFSFAAATLAPGAVANISLPGFTGPEGPVALLIDGTPPPNVTTVIFSRPTGLVLSLTFLQATPIPSGETTLTIPESALVKLPAAGVLADENGMAVDLFPGGASRVSAAFLAEPVGAFLGTPSLSFSPAKSGEVHNLTIAFETNAGLGIPATQNPEPQNPNTPSTPTRKLINNTNSNSKL